MTRPRDDADHELRFAGIVAVVALVCAAVLSIRARPADAAPVLAALGVLVALVHDLCDS